MKENSEKTNLISPKKLLPRHPDLGGLRNILHNSFNLFSLDLAGAFWNMFQIQMIQVKIVLRIPHGHLQMEDSTQILLVKSPHLIMMNLSPHPLQPLMNPSPHPLPLLLINHFGLTYPLPPPTFDDTIPHT